MSDCDKGFRGDCCCNCKNQLKLMCHPWNGGERFDKIKFGKGSISQQCGWVCIAEFEDESNKGRAIFYDFEHGMCELHERRETKTPDFLPAKP